MSDKEFNKAAQNEQRLVVKNKKYKKGDILAFALCLLAALIIWIYATNVEVDQVREHEELLEDLSVVSEKK